MLSLLALLVSLAGTAWSWSAPSETKAPIDSFHYLRMAYERTGLDDADARREAYERRCRYWDATTEPAGGGYKRQVPLPKDAAELCAAVPADLTGNERYESIFEARVAFPALIAAAEPLLGDGAAAGVTLALALGCGLALFALVALLSGSAVAASVAVAAFYCMPVGLWSTRISPEGGALLGTLVALLGLHVVLRRPVPGALLLAAGLGTTYAFKSANAVLVCAAAVAVGAVWALAPRLRRSGLVVLAVAAGCGAAMLLADALLGHPGAATTVQDLLTKHFAEPDVADPWAQLLRLDRHVLEAAVRQPGRASVLLLAVGLLVLGFARHGLRFLGLASIAPVGVGVVLAHPVVSEFDRLVAPAWVPLAAGVGLAAQALVERLLAGGAGRRRHASVAGGAPPPEPA